ncbi:MAG TPA: hypothetical protein VN673_00080 [Clostridia bacterium]|nr:hypothetical protein [Clostridia bacterium]
MNTVLICPSWCPGVERLALTTPLAAIPTMGMALIEYWMCHLAAHEISDVIVVSPDRPTLIRELIGSGERWGLQITIDSAAFSSDLTGPDCSPDGVANISANQVLSCLGHWTSKCPPDLQRLIVADHFPEESHYGLFSNYRAWFAGVIRWMPHALTPDRVGIRQSHPGIWINSTARVSSRAELHPPCWIGAHTRVGPRATIGPETILEDRCLIEGDSQITESYVGQETYIGPYAELRHSIALGSTLINWRNGSEVTLYDPFLMASLRQVKKTTPPPTLIETPVHTSTQSSQA